MPTTFRWCRLGLALAAVAAAAAWADDGAWWRFDRLVGAYDVDTPDQAKVFAQAGFTLTLLGRVPPGSALDTALADNHIVYIDQYPQYELYRVCLDQYHTAHRCNPKDEAAVLKAIRLHLVETAQDPKVLGYWILDDYPYADIKPMLRAIKALIGEANRTAIFPRPAICSFGGDLAFKYTTPEPEFRVDNSYFDLAVSQFDAKACDMVALDPYGSSTSRDHRVIDWTMKDVLPHMMAALRARGWDQRRAPLIGVPQTHASRDWSTKLRYTVEPTSEDLVTQIEAYCRAGAVALLAYSWNDITPPPKQELFNTPAMVRGLQQGAELCRQRYWR